MSAVVILDHVNVVAHSRTLVEVVKKFHIIPVTDEDASLVRGYPQPSVHVLGYGISPIGIPS